MKIVSNDNNNDMTLLLKCDDIFDRIAMERKRNRKREIERKRVRERA